MADANPSLVFEQIRFLCDRFGRDWEKDKHPQIEAYLQQVAEASRTTLLRNLLLAEVDQRRRRHEDPQVEEYLARFPDDEFIIRQVFSCSMTVSVQARAERQDTSLGQDDSGATELFTAPPPRQLGNYLLLHKLGQGGFGEVWEAEHVEQRYRVALKMLPSDNQDRLDSYDAADRLHKFRQEFRRLHDVNHPNLVGMQKLERDGLQWFFAMDLVKGVDFLSYVRPHGTLDEARLRSAFAQLVAGVAELHRRNIVHRDLKPSNVMVSHEERVIILDFGLVVDLDQRQVSQTEIHFAGTPNYAAPEQLDSEPTLASDWYAVGTMLYEALTNHLPYSDSNPYALMRNKADQEPHPIEDADLPKDLVALALQLLDRSAKQRPAGSELIKQFGVVAILQPMTGATLIGRESQLAELGTALSEVKSQQQSLSMFVSGRSGEGKSALVERFLEPLRNDSRFTVLSGRCYDRESVPFKALDPLIDALCSNLRSLGDQAAFLIPDDVLFLVDLFPFMKRVEVVGKAVALRQRGDVDDQQVRQRAFAALRELLQRMGRSRPTILFVDDLQWGDKDSAEALFHLLRPTDAPRLLFLGSYREEAAAQSPFMQEWHQQQEVGGAQLIQREITVGPLDTEQCRQMIESELDVGIDVSVVEQLLDDSSGNPFLLTELIGCIDASTGTVERIPLSEVIARKLARLPTDAVGLLDMISVSGQQLELGEAAEAAGLGTEATAIALHMRSEKVLRLTGTQNEIYVDTYHDKIRETTLRNLAARRRKDLHRALAETIETHVGGEQGVSPRVYDLAYHFDAAREYHKACRYGLEAAEQARRQLALVVAAEQFAIAKRNSTKASDAVRYRIAVGYGESLMLLGQYDEAAEQLDGAIPLTQDGVEQARVEAIQGEIAFKRGRMNDSMTYYESGLRRIGVWVPRTMFGLGYGLLRETLIQGTHSFLPNRLHRKQRTKQHDLAIRLFSRLGHPASFRNVPKMAWTMMAGLNRGEQVAPSPSLVFGYALYGVMMHMIGWHSRGAMYGDRATELALSFNDRWGEALSLSYLGMGFFASAKYQDGVTAYEKAVQGFESMGDLWELHLAQFHLGCLHYGMGELCEATQVARKTFESSARVGDPRTHCSLYLWSKATGGNLPFDELKARISTNEEDILSTCNLDKAEGYWHGYHDRTESAVEAFRRAWDVPVRNHLLIFHSVAGLPPLVAALRRHATAVESDDSAHASRLRKEALRRANRALWLGRLFPTEYPSALRELSLLYADLGRTKAALKAAEKSCRVAKRQMAKYEYAQSQLICGKLASELGLPEANEKIVSAKAELQKFDKMICEASSS